MSLKSGYNTDPPHWIFILFDNTAKTRKYPQLSLRSFVVYNIAISFYFLLQSDPLYELVCVNINTLIYTFLICCFLIRVKPKTKFVDFVPI